MLEIPASRQAELTFPSPLARCGRRSRVAVRRVPGSLAVPQGYLVRPGDSALVTLVFLSSSALNLQTLP